MCANGRVPYNPHNELARPAVAEKKRKKISRSRSVHAFVHVVQTLAAYPERNTERKTVMYSPRTRSTRATGAALRPVLLAGLAAATAAAPLVLTRPAPAHAAALVAARQDEDAAPAASSRLTGVKLPAGAVRVADKNATRAGLGQLKRIADAGKMTINKTEHLAWGGDGHDADRAESVKKRLAEILEAAGYQYKSAGQKKVEGGGTMTFFFAIHEKKSQAVLGIWMEGETFLVLNWGEVSKAGAAKPADKSDENTDDEPTSGGGAA
jgi:hypothetical protein